MSGDANTVREALGEDAAGRPFSELLREAASSLNAHGGGPLADCLVMKADQLEAVNITAISRLAAAVTQRDALRNALEWIEVEPEDPIKVQLWARTALSAVSPAEERGE